MYEPYNYASILSQAQGLQPDYRADQQRQQLLNIQQQQADAQRMQLQARAAEAQREAERQSQYRALVGEFVKNPTAQGAADLQILFPEFREAIKGGWETKDKAIQDADLREVAGIFGYLNSGAPDKAKSALERRIAADKEAGQDTTDDEELLALIDEDPAKARGSVGLILSSIVGADKFAGVLEQTRLSQGGEGFTLAPGSVRYGADGEIIAESPYKPEVIRDPETGAVYTFTPGKTGGEAGGAQTGGSPRGLRNNNPGNIKDGGFAKSQPGYKGSDGTFAVFETPEQGTAAQRRLLSGNYLGKGVDTPAKIVARYAPSSENSGASMQNYAAHIAKRLGIGVDDKVPASRVGELQQAMAEFENGTQNRPSATESAQLRAQAQDAIRRGADPAKVNARLRQLLGGS